MNRAAALRSISTRTVPDAQAETNSVCVTV
jgi:hypothetical protein